MKVKKGVRMACPMGVACSESRGKNCVTFYVRQGKVIVQEKNVLMSLRVVK
jgi:hypothetical protein